MKAFSLTSSSRLPTVNKETQAFPNGDHVDALQMLHFLEMSLSLTMKADDLLRFQHLHLRHTNFCQMNINL